MDATVPFKPAPPYDSSFESRARIIRTPKARTQSVGNQTRKQAANDPSTPRHEVTRSELRQNCDATMAEAAKNALEWAKTLPNSKYVIPETTPDASARPAASKSFAAAAESSTCRSAARRLK